MTMNLLTYRLATLADFEDFYRIKCDKENIVWGGFTKAPEKKSFYNWYVQQLASDRRWIYLVYEGNEVCAFFYIDKIDNKTYELSSSGVLAEFSGRGIGTYTVKVRMDIIRSLGGKTCITWIAEDNIGSYKRFEKIGFVRTDEYEVRNLPLLGGEHKFYKWVKEL